MTGPKRQYIRPEQRTFNRPVKSRTVYKPVKTSGSAGHVYVAPAWIGKWVRVTVLTDEEVAKLKAEGKIES